MSESEWENDFFEAQNKFEEIRERGNGSRRTFSVEIRGESVYYLMREKKRAGISGSRGQFVSEAISFFVRHSPDQNKFNEMEFLRRRIQFLEDNISGLQAHLKQD